MSLNSIRDYSILSTLGEGGMGTVYLAEDLLGRKVALKILNPLLTQDPKFVERFLLEAKVQSSLIHPNIVALHAFFREAGYECMVMEYAEGSMLKSLIEQSGMIPEEQALHIFRQLLQAVGYAHNKGIVHRDIKPSNIVVGQDGTVKVMDFGIAKILGERGMTRTGAKMGTLYYMSPEQVRAAKDIDQRTDIYSMGITLFEMLTGRLPLDTGTESDFEIMQQIIEGAIPDPRTINPDISPATSALVLSMVAKDRERRPHDCGLCEEAIRHAEGDVRRAERDPDRVIAKKPATRQARKKPPEKQGMILVRGGTFSMGSTGGLGAVLSASMDSDEFPRHTVELRSFYLDCFPVTVAEFRAFCRATGWRMPEEPQWGWFDDHPIVNVTWKDAVAYAASFGKRLPTEAEWEFAALGGLKSENTKYSGGPWPDDVAWFYDNSEGHTHPVGQKHPNELGLYDMSGNICEWCADWYDEDYYGRSPRVNPPGPESGSLRVIRGGSWCDTQKYLRVKARNYEDPEGADNIGFRCAADAR